MWPKKTIGVVGLVLWSTCSIGATHQLAFSKRMGVEVLAEEAGDWCKSDLRLTLEAKDREFFDSLNLNKLVQTVGDKVLPNECPAAERAFISGRHMGNVVWNGVAEKSNGWLVTSERESQKGSDSSSRDGVINSGDVSSSSNNFSKWFSRERLLIGFGSFIFIIGAVWLIMWKRGQSSPKQRVVTTVASEEHQTKEASAGKREKRFCTECGAQLEANRLFCTKCGAKTGE